MRRRSSKGPKSTVATHFPSLSRGPDIDPNIHMFTQDVQLALMPIRGRKEKHKDFAVELVGSAAGQEMAQQLLGQIGRYDRRNLAGMVCDAIDEIARHLAWEGCAAYELTRGDDGIHHIVGFTSKGLWKLPGLFLQVIPRGDWGLWKKRFVVIPASRVWYFEMPEALGSRKGYSGVLRQLRRFEHLGPEFWRNDLEQGIQSRDFDFQAYVRNTDIYYGQVTKTWGWNRRDWTQDRCTEFFTFYKMIRFKEAQAILREHIVAELNGIFARLGIDCDLQVKGLPTPEDIRQIQRELAEGKVTFLAASDRVRL